MQQNSSITILVAEDNEVSRNLMAGILRQQGFNVIGAIDGESAIKVIREREVDMAFVDINMAPAGGFDFMRYLIAQAIRLPVVVVTADESADMLMNANALNAAHVLQKPILPERLVQTAHRVLKSSGLKTKPIAIESHTPLLSAKELMKKAIELAGENARKKMGGPYGAIIADESGKIISQGLNGIGSRADPTAHAEVMAIRLAADKLGTSDLSGCVLYCSSQPTLVGHAVIRSVGIKTVYFGLTHEEIGTLKDSKIPAEPNYNQLCHEEALTMFRQFVQK